MDIVHTAMDLYPYVFHPAIVVGAGAFVLIYHEWARQDADPSVLFGRIGAFLGAGLLSLLPTLGYVLFTGQGLFEVTKGNVWQVDALVASGIFIATATTWLVWRYFDWGTTVPGYVEALAIVTIPYVALSPFWNISGHVILALTPTLYVTLVDRRFWPSLAIPVVMVPNRVYLGAHTWAQSVGGLLLATGIVVGVFRAHSDSQSESTSDSSTS